MQIKTKHIFTIIMALFVRCNLYAQINHYAISPGLVLPELTISHNKTMISDGSIPEIPTYIDNSTSIFFPEIINQYGGSCAQASGIHYLFTYEMNRVLERNTKSDPKNNTFSYRYTWHYLNDGKEKGSSSSDGIEIIMTSGCPTVANYGNENESSYRWISGYSKYYNAMHYKAKSMSKVDLRTHDGIEKLRYYMYDKDDGHPGGGIASFAVHGDWGIYNYSGPSQTDITYIMQPKGAGGAHAMTLVGYDMSVEFDCDNDGIIMDDEKGAFIFVNSWGTWWGTDGKAYMPFSAFTRESGHGGFYPYGDDPEALCVDAEYHEPSLAMQVNMEYTSRNDITMRFGVADGAQATHPDKGCYVEYDNVMKAQGGDWVMQGTYSSDGKNIEMGFDLSELKAAADTMKAPCWFLIISKIVTGKNGEGTVNAIRIHDYRSGTEIVKSQAIRGQEAVLSAGTKYLKIPTKDWFKDASGKWYNPVKTAASGYVANTNYMKAFDWNKIIAVKKADGGYSKVKFTNYDSKTKKLKFVVNNYEIK